MLWRFVTMISLLLFFPHIKMKLVIISFCIRGPKWALVRFCSCFIQNKLYLIYFVIISVYFVTFWYDFRTISLKKSCLGIHKISKRTLRETDTDRHQKALYDIYKRFYDTFCIFKNRPMGSPFGEILKKFKFVKCSIWDIFFLLNI